MYSITGGARCIIIDDVDEIEEENCSPWERPYFLPDDIETGVIKTSPHKNQATIEEEKPSKIH